MIRDPSYYLSKAKYFSRMANREPVDTVEDVIDNSTDKNYETNGIKLQPVILEEVKTVAPKIKPQYARYYDPITKHYYKTIDIIGGNISQNEIKDGNVWFPENKPNVQTFRDPKTGKYYRINKIYDQNGNYTYMNDELVYMAQRPSGTNFYKPVHIKLA